MLPQLDLPDLAPNLHRTGGQKLLEAVFHRDWEYDLKFVDLPIYLTESADGQRLDDAIVQVLDTITDREGRVLTLRFGLDGSRSRTLDEVVQEFGVTRERIRQIEAKGLRKLRHLNRSDILRPFVRPQDPEDTEAMEQRHELWCLIEKELGESLAVELAQRMTRYYLPEAIQAAQQGFPKVLNLAVVNSCQVTHTFTPCPLCDEPVPLGMDWCLVHLNMYKRNQMVLICDGCGIKFPRDLAHMTGFLTRVGRTQHQVYHNKACFYEHCSELFQKVRRKGRASLAPST